jgi:hypothetical protein
MTCAIGNLLPHRHCAKVDGLGGFLLVGCLPFFMAGAVDGIGIAVDVSLEAATGAAGAAAFFLFFFVLVVAEGTMGGRAGGTMMTSIHPVRCGCPELFLDGLDNQAHLVPWVDLQHCKQSQYQEQ